MSFATADAYSTIGLRKPTVNFWYESPVIEQPPLPHVESWPSDSKLEMLIGPTPSGALWLPAVEKRISASIAMTDCEYVNDGSWLDADVAGQALAFFQATSDVLPSEPYIYTSIEGDLVAEFRTPRGSMTSIVGKSSVINFAVIDQTVIKATLDLTDWDVDKARDKMRDLAAQF